MNYLGTSGDNEMARDNCRLVQKTPHYPTGQERADHGSAEIVFTREKSVDKETAKPPSYKLTGDGDRKQGGDPNKTVLFEIKCACAN